MCPLHGRRGNKRGQARAVFHGESERGNKQPVRRGDDLNAAEHTRCGRSRNDTPLKLRPARAIDVIHRAVLSGEVVVPHDVIRVDVVLLHKIRHQLRQCRNRLLGEFPRFVGVTDLDMYHIFVVPRCGLQGACQEADGAGDYRGGTFGGLLHNRHGVGTDDGGDTLLRGKRGNIYP